MKLRLFSFIGLIACDPPSNGPQQTTEYTYYRDVKPIIDQTCTRCHSDDGVAPVSFDDPDTVRTLSAAIRAYTQGELMPPPAPDPECHDYHDAEKMFLSDTDRDILAEWDEQGAPLGDPSQQPGNNNIVEYPPFDIEMFGSQPYEPSFTDSGNDYRCFQVHADNVTDTFITGFGVSLDNLPYVHHVVLFRTEQSLNAENPEQGFPCSGVGENGWEYLAGWGPGASPTLFPDSSGIRLEPDTTLVLQMHYFDSGATGTDQSGFGFWTADEVEREIIPFQFGALSLFIPAGEAEHEETESITWNENYPDISIVGVWPHMHVLGSGMDLVIRRDDEEQCVLDQNGWSFHNQVPVVFKEPIVVTGGDKIRLTCHYNNSEENPNQYNHPPEDVRFGEGTEDEMCFAFSYVWLGTP